MADAPEIRLGNGVEVLGEVECFFDPVEVGHSGIYCLSHAHFDHLPRKMRGNSMLCSGITLRCARERLKRDIRQAVSDKVEMLGSGHILGSTMFLLKGERRVLYTGDMCTRDRFDMEGAKPVKTEVLVLEATYGLPRYVFPPVEEMQKAIRDWVDDQLGDGRSVAIFSYPLGKSQEMLTMLGDHSPFIYGSSLQTTKLMEEEGQTFNYRPFEPYSVEDPFLLICPTGSRRTAFMEKLRKRGMVTAAVSGWAIDPSFKHRMGVDETFPLSDHSDYSDLLAFARRCDPSVVLTHHGFDKELAAAIRNNLGIEAFPLLRDQNSLMQF